MKKRFLAAALCISLLSGCGAVPAELPEPEQPETSSAIAYVPLDDRPDNVGRVQYLAESLGYTLNMPEEWMYKTLLDGQLEDYYAENGMTLTADARQCGSPTTLYDWVLEQEAAGCDRYILSMDQMLYGGLVASRLAEKTTERNGTAQPLSELIKELLEALAADPNNEVWLLDSVMRLAPTVGYMGGSLEYYNAMRTVGAAPRKALTGDELTLGNILSTYDTDANGNDLLDFGGDSAMHEAAVRYTEHRLNKLALSGELLEAVNSLSSDRFHVLIGIDDSSSENCIQKNEIAYLRARLRPGDVILSGVDDLAFKAVAKLYLSETGWDGARANVQYFGGTENQPACDYDYKPLTEIVAEHLDYFDLTAEDAAAADLYVLVLTQPKDPSQKQTYIKDLLQVLKQRLDADLPVVLIDAGNGQYGTAFHDALTKNVELGKLLSYAGFLDMAIVTGTALSHGVARYAHLTRNATSQAEEEAFCKTLADSILKDFCYKNVVREDILSYVRNELGGDANNFCQPELDRAAIVERLASGMEAATAPVLKNLEHSNLLASLDSNGAASLAGWGAVSLSNYRFPWERAFEIDMDMDISSPVHPHKDILGIYYQ